MISERLADAIDARRDQSKERRLSPQPDHDFPEDAIAERASTTKDPMTSPQAIPVIAQQAIAIFAFLDAAIAAAPFSISFAERIQPGAAETVVAWARSHSLPVSEVWFPQTGGYANVRVVLDGGRDIDVLHSRDLTAEELATLMERTHMEVAL